MSLRRPDWLDANGQAREPGPCAKTSLPASVTPPKPGPPPPPPPGHPTILQTRKQWTKEQWLKHAADFKPCWESLTKAVVHYRNDLGLTRYKLIHLLKMSGYVLKLVEAGTGLGTMDEHVRLRMFTTLLGWMQWPNDAATVKAWVFGTHALNEAEMIPHREEWEQHRKKLNEAYARRTAREKWLDDHGIHKTHKEQPTLQYMRYLESELADADVELKVLRGRLARLEATAKGLDAFDIARLEKREGGVGFVGLTGGGRWDA